MREAEEAGTGSVGFEVAGCADGGLRKICWRRKGESPLWAETERVVQQGESRRPEIAAALAEHYARWRAARGR